MDLGVYLFSNSRFDPDKSYTKLTNLTREYEEAGISTIWSAESLAGNVQSGTFAHYETYALLTGLSQQSNTIKFGSLVTPYNIHHIGVLAKRITTIDHLSQGRIIAGLGLGELNNITDGWGISRNSLKYRFQEFEEYVRCLKELFSGRSVSSELLHLSDVGLDPQPYNKSIPLLIGGGGEKKTLPLVAEYADMSNYWGDKDTIIHKTQTLYQLCDRIGRDPNEITKTTMIAIVTGKDDDELEQEIQRYTNRIIERGGRKPKLEEFKSNRIVGTIEEVGEQFDQYKEIGINHLILTINTPGSKKLSKELVELLN